MRIRSYPLLLIICLLLAALFCSVGYAKPKNYFAPGSQNTLNIGGTETVLSGGTLNVASGGTTSVGAGANLNVSSTATVTGHLVQSFRWRVTAANITASTATSYTTLLPAVTGKSYRIVDFKVISKGAAGGLTSLDICVGTTALIQIPAALLTDNAPVGLGGANIVYAANGAAFNDQAANTSIRLYRTGGAITTATDIDVILSYCLE